MHTTFSPTDTSTHSGLAAAIDHLKATKRQMLGAMPHAHQTHEGRTTLRRHVANWTAAWTRAERAQAAARGQPTM